MIKLYKFIYYIGGGLGEPGFPKKYKFKVKVKKSINKKKLKYF